MTEITARLKGNEKRYPGRIPTEYMRADAVRRDLHLPAEIESWDAATEERGRWGAEEAQSDGLLAVQGAQGQMRRGEAVVSELLQGGRNMRLFNSSELGWTVAQG